MTEERRRISTNTHWEQVGGYSRAIRVGERILISGTTVTQDEIASVLNDPAGQTRIILGKIRDAIEALDGSISDVVRVRIYVKDIDDWEKVARVHGEFFGDIRPANTLVQANLVGEGVLVEIEAEAVISYRI